MDTEEILHEILDTLFWGDLTEQEQQELLSILFPPEEEEDEDEDEDE